MTKIFTPFWLSGASLALSLAWLLPNHSLPWLSFHGDAWSGIVLCVVACVVLVRTNFTSIWNPLTLVIAITAGIPILQYFGGLIPIFGVAWINSAYMMGFLLALLTGSAWERNQSHQVGDFLFLATVTASMVSVGLQLHQFFRLESVGPWILYSSGTRHFANMAQPNQLASLLLLGTLGCGWAYERKLIGPYIAISAAAFFLIGTVLTESRTAWLNVLLIISVSIIWRKTLPSRAYSWGVVGLGLFFLVCVLNLPAINDYFGGGMPVEFRSATSDPRWAAWTMFLKAAVFKPFFGFGWGQLGHAQFLMMDEGISFGGSFLQSHNIFIDLILWNGIVIGIILIAVIIWWLWTTLNTINTFHQLMLMSFIIVLGTHSMLEYPLHYSYFLLPCGLAIGGLIASTKSQSILMIGKRSSIVVLVISTIMLTITIRDYFRTEDSFYGLRFEQKKIKSDYPLTPPDVLALTQWRDYILFARMEPKPDVSNADLSWMRNLVSTIPSAFVMYRFAATLAVNNQPAEATLWLKRLCQTSPKEQCEVIMAEWKKQSKSNPKIAAIQWPN